MIWIVRSLAHSTITFRGANRSQVGSYKAAAADTLEEATINKPLSVQEKLECQLDGERRGGHYHHYNHRAL